MQTENQLQAGTIQNELPNLISLILTRSEKLNFRNIHKETKVTENNYELFGNLAYLLGLGFSQSKWTKENLVPLLTRLNKFNVNSSTFKNFLEIVKSTDISEFEKGKTRMINFINDPIEKDYSIKNIVVSIIKSSLVPVNLSKNLTERFIINPDEQLIYHDLLIFNNSFYEDFIVNNNSSKKFIELNNNLVYQEKIKEAVEYFDFQKFALIYFENIINLKTFLDFINIDDIQLFIDLAKKEHKSPEELNNDLDIVLNHYENNVLPKFKTEKIIEESIESEIVDDIKEFIYVPEENEESIMEISQTEAEEQSEILSDPENEIKAFLEEFSNVLESQGFKFDYKNNITDFCNMLIKLLEGEDQELVGSFYTYLKQIKQNQETSDKFKININNILNFNNEEVVELMMIEIQKYQTEYTNFNTKYLSEIDVKDSIIINEINNVIKMLFIQDQDDKSILLSQLDQNIINTYKNMHEVLVSIEKQFISGNEIIFYTELYNKLNENHNDIYEMFMNSKVVDELTLKIKLLYGFKNIVD